MTPTLTPEEAAKEAVIAAALAWDDDEPESHSGLVLACRALRAFRQPKGVKPEEVEPGTRFRFVGAERPYMCVLNLDLKKMALDEVNWTLYEFTGAPRIIPIDPEDS